MPTSKHGVTANGHSHLQATLLGPSLMVPVRDGKPVLGTRQQIFHIECDVRPRERTVVVTVLGEGGSGRRRAANPEASRRAGPSKLRLFRRLWFRVSEA